MTLDTTTATRCATAPTAGSGVEIGAGDWRLVVEHLVGTGSVVGACVVGSPSTSPVGNAVVGTLAWEDITGYVRGMEWTRGADEPNGRPRVGAITVEIFNPTDGRYDPWVKYGPTRPGSVMRAGIISSTDTRANGWVPLWTGVVEDWPIEHFGATRSGYRADSSVRVALNETLGELSQVNGTAGSAVGAGEGITARTARLLEGLWKFGLVTLWEDDFGVEPSITLQATTMSGNRITELYLSADSVGAIVRSDVTGALLVTTNDIDRTDRLSEFSSADFGGGAIPLIVLDGSASDHDNAGLWHIMYDADSVVTATNRDGIYNDYRWARVGGTQQVVEHSVSIGRFGRKTMERSELLSSTNADVLAVATGACNLTARTALRLENVTVTAMNREYALLAVAAADVHDSVWMFPSAADGFAGSGLARIRSMTHQITPLTDSAVHWTASYALDFYSFTSVDGAILDPI